ncbi:hypothetical protein FGO68_gene17529 [Halteria grandinella]|uniref:Uncharacterized protein n=1 Tax=Halteria grandinella TaxID=5974 RepID=A0A8J8T764_HALGN|nr:hypothetical protein FGO68_gene17529 [Halteria grandinella]
MSSSTIGPGDGSATNTQGHTPFTFQNTAQRQQLYNQLGQQNIVYRQMAATQSKIIPHLFAPVKTSRLRQSPIIAKFDHQDSATEDNEIREQLQAVNSGGDWQNPGIKNQASMKQKQPEVSVQTGVRDSPAIQHRPGQYYHLHLQMQHPPIQSVIDSDGDKGSTHQFYESIRSSNMWPNNKDNLDAHLQSQIQWNSKLPHINIQIDSKRGTAANRMTPQDLSHLNSTFSQEVPIANKMFPKRHRKHLSMEKTHYVPAVQSSGVGTLKGVVDMGAAAQDGKAPQIQLPVQEKSLPVSRQRDQLVNAGYKSVLGGGYYSALGDFKGTSTLKTKYLTPLRQIMNTSVLDAKTLGFDRQPIGEESPNANVKPSSPRKELKRKQLMAYHGWLKSKQKSQLSHHKKEAMQLGIGQAQTTEETTKPESPTQKPQEDYKQHSKREVQFSPLIPVQERERNPGPFNYTQPRKQTHVIPDIFLFQQNESLSTIDRDYSIQQSQFQNSQQFDGSRRSLKGLFRKTSKKQQSFIAPTPEVIQKRQIQQKHNTSPFNNHNMSMDSADNKVMVQDSARQSTQLQGGQELKQIIRDLTQELNSPIVFPHKQGQPAFSIGYHGSPAVISSVSPKQLTLPQMPPHDHNDKQLEHHNILHLKNNHRNSPRLSAQNTREEKDQTNTIALVNRIRDQKNKKRRGKFNKNEALYEFIEQMHRLNDNSQLESVESGRQQYFSPQPRYQQPAYQPASQLRTELGYYN